MPLNNLWLSCLGRPFPRSPIPIGKRDLTAVSGFAGLRPDVKVIRRSYQLRQFLATPSKRGNCEIHQPHRSVCNARGSRFRSRNVRPDQVLSEDHRRQPGRAYRPQHRVLDQLVKMNHPEKSMEGLAPRS